MASKEYGTTQRAERVAQGIRRVFGCQVRVGEIDTQYFRVSCRSITQDQMDAIHNLLLPGREALEALIGETVEAEVARIRAERLQRAEESQPP
jgi:hypothetical protein